MSIAAIVARENRERYTLPGTARDMPPLTLADTCDRCGPAVPAYVQVRVHRESILRFCGHCFTVHEAALIAAGYETRDERSRLAPAVSTHRD